MPTSPRPVLLLGLVIAFLFAVTLIGPRILQPLGMDVGLSPALADLDDALKADTDLSEQLVDARGRNERLNELVMKLVARQQTLREVATQLGPVEAEIAPQIVLPGGRGQETVSPEELRGRQLIAWVISQLEFEGRPEEAQRRGRELEDELQAWLAECRDRRGSKDQRPREPENR